MSYVSSGVVDMLLTAGTDGNVFSRGALPHQQQRGNMLVVVHSSASKTKNSESERDTESITLDQFLDECNKSPKSRVCITVRLCCGEISFWISTHIEFD